MRDENPDPNRRFQRRAARRKRLGWLAVLVLGLAICAVGGAAMLGRPVAAPDWLRGKIEERLGAQLSGLQVDFGQMSVELSRQGEPRVILWDVDIRNAHGQPVASLSDIEVGLDPASLLRGDAVVQSANVSGAYLTVRRDASGALGLSLGDVFAAGTQTPDLQQILRAVDEALTDPRLERLALFEADALTIRYEDIRARRGWTADGGRLRVTREEGRLSLSGDVALLSGTDSVAAIEMNATSPIGSTRMAFGLRLTNLSSRDIASQSEGLAWLDVIEAPISGALRSGLRADGSLDVLHASLQIGAGQLHPNAQVRPLPFDGAHAYFSFDRDSAVLNFDEIALHSPLLSLSAEGRAQMQGLDAGWPSGLIGQFRFADIALAKEPPLHRDVALSGAEAAFKLTLEPFRLSLGALRITDPDLPLRASGELEAYSDGWDVALNATLAQLTPAALLSWWPEDQEPKARQWVTDHIHHGVLRDLTYALRLSPEAGKKQFVDLKFSEGQFHFNHKLPEIYGASGRMSFYENRLGIRLDHGVSDVDLGDPVDLAGTEFIIPDTRARPARGLVRLQARASVTSALSYLDNDTWRILRKVGRDAGMATGEAEMSGLIELPLVKGVKLDQVAMELGGTLLDVQSDRILKGKTLSARQLALRLTGQEVVITGSANAGGVPVQGSWRQPLQGGAGRVDADVSLSTDSLAALGVRLPPGLLQGQGQGALEVLLPKGAPPQFSLRSSLAGIGMRIPQLGWQLDRDARGDFRVSGRVTQPVQVDALSLSGAGLEAAGGLSLRAGGQLDRLRLERLKVGAWLDAVGELQGRGAGQPPAVILSAGRIDLRNAPLGQRGGASGAAARTAAATAPMPISLSLEQLQVTDKIWIADFRGDFAASQGFSGQFDGKLGGKAKITGIAQPQNGATAFRIEGEDAGDVLKAAAILKTVQDGVFRLDLAPVQGQSGSYDGKMTIAEPRLQKAPAIASLLDAVSIVGLLDQLNGPGIYFSEVEAVFRLTPSRLILRRSSAVGPSMGISLDGYYDLTNDRLDMQGVLSPIYLVNGIGRLIAPRKGEGLIGFNFNMRGAAKNPRVAVNPLSAFTPGMFRDIFRRPPPEVSQ